jgi:DNA-binding response OmpR family regulator
MSAALAVVPAARVRVLVVEDDPSCGRLITFILEQSGYEHCLVTDGREALVALAEFRPEIVVLDWMVPGLTGVEVSEAIRRFYGECVPILMVTARDGSNDHQTALDAGADRVLTKPFSPAVLRGELGQLLAG